MSFTNNEPITQSTNDSHPYFTFYTDAQGNQVLVLRESYRSNGTSLYSCSQGNGDQFELPDMLEIPSQIGEIQVTSLAPGMFFGNTRVNEIRLPATVTTIPEAFCCGARNLRAIHGTEHITSIGTIAFMRTRIKEALFPKLETLVVNSSANTPTFDGSAFANCAYLETVHIGKVSNIPLQSFYRCSCLRNVFWKGDTITIDEQAFYQTRSLRSLPLLEHATDVGDYAFFYSRISDYTLPENCTLGTKPFPTVDNEIKFWLDVESTPHQNRIVTKLSQTNSAWETKTFLSNYGTQYKDGCALFAVMHIHSAITGKYYSHPDEFVAELTAKGLSSFLDIRTWPGEFSCVASRFEDLGYHAEVCGNGTNLSKGDYQALVDALADGAYIYTQVCTFNNWNKEWDNNNQPNAGHAVVIYGINDLGEVCVLDSDILHDDFLEGDSEPNIDLYTYTIPYQNIVGPGSDFVIVYPPEEEPAVEWTGTAAANAFTSASKPSDYPENQVTVCRVSGDTGTPGSSKGILTAYRVGTNAYRTFMPHSKAALYLQIRSSTEDKWLDWTECNRKDFTKLGNNKIFSTTTPSSLPTGVNVSTISSEGDLELLPEGKKGYLTAYNLFSSAENAREEWQPNGSINKYVRYATDTGHWGPWHIFTTTIYTSPADSTSSEGQ